MFITQRWTSSNISIHSDLVDSTDTQQWSPSSTNSNSDDVGDTPSPVVPDVLSVEPEFARVSTAIL